MSLSLSERKKLLDMLQRDFTLADKWKYIKNDHHESRIKHWAEYLALPVCGAITVGAVWLMDWAFGFSSVWGFLSSVALGAVALMGISLCGAIAMVHCKSIENMFKIKKCKKDNQHRTWMRDYVALNTAKRKVAQLLPVLSDDELALLFNLPHLNERFKPFFEKEVARRQKVKSTQNITEEFLSSSVKVDTGHSRTTPNVALTKNLIV